MPNGEFVPLAPLLTKLGVMLAVSLMVERFLAIFNWLMNRLFLIRSSATWEGTEIKQKDLDMTT